METKFKTLVHNGEFINVSMLNDGLYTTSVPTLYSKLSDIEKIRESYKSFYKKFGPNYLAVMNESLNKCELVDIEISFTKPEIKAKIGYNECVDFWLKEFHTDFQFSAVSGVKLKSLIKKMSKLIVSKGYEVTSDSILAAFKMICERLPDYYKTKDLSILDSKFNEIIAEIKIKGNGKGNINSASAFSKIDAAYNRS